MPWTTATCNAWPDDSESSLKRVLKIWGWTITHGQRVASWQELSELAHALAHQHEHRDDYNWGLVHVRGSGWQMVLNVRPSLGGLRHVEEPLPFPMVEWVVYGNDDAFDLDVMVGRELFAAHVRGGILDHTVDRVDGNATVKSGNSSPDVLLRIGIPVSYELPSEVAVYASLTRTLRGLRVPEPLWPVPSEVEPTYLHLVSD